MITANQSFNRQDIPSASFSVRAAQQSACSALRMCAGAQGLTHAQCATHRPLLLGRTLPWEPVRDEDEINLVYCQIKLVRESPIHAVRPRTRPSPRHGGACPIMVQTIQKIQRISVVAL